MDKFQIGRKNMTGKLQKLRNANFFLCIISTAFDAGHINFQRSTKAFNPAAEILSNDVNILKNTASCNAFFRHVSFVKALPIMFSSLQKRWKVSKTDLLLILCVFAITGTTTAFLSRALPGWVGFTEDTHWAPKLLLRLAVLLFGYQAILLCVAFLFGQFPFFWRFEKKLLQRLKLLKEEETPTTDNTNKQPHGKN